MANATQLPFLVWKVEYWCGHAWAGRSLQKLQRRADRAGIRLSGFRSSCPFVLLLSLLFFVHLFLKFGHVPLVKEENKTNKYSKSAHSPGGKRKRKHKHKRKHGPEAAVSESASSRQLLSQLLDAFASATPVRTMDTATHSDPLQYFAVEPEKNMLAYKVSILRQTNFECHPCLFVRAAIGPKHQITLTRVVNTTLSTD